MDEGKNCPLSASKLRPALVLHEGDRDVVVALYFVKNSTSTNRIGSKNHPEFPLAGVKVDSVIKLDKIATLSKNLIIGEIGEAGKTIREEVNKKLCKILRI